MCENGQDGQVGCVAMLAMLATLPVTPSAFTIEVKGDSKREGNETFDLDLYGLSVCECCSPRTAASARS